MKKPVFIDTSYVLALKFHDDEFHQEAKAMAPTILQALTTEAVLIEIGNSLSRQGWRLHGVAAITDIRNDPGIKVVAVSTKLFERGYLLYSSRLDKNWSLTDCISFVVMQERGLTEALTTDHHFEQAGFCALLREQKN